MEGYSYLLDLAIILLSTKVLGLATRKYRCHRSWEHYWQDCC